MSKKKFYITTSIAYTNASPHIGFALELVQADVSARYRKILGEDVLFQTGTDEHGQKIVRAAKEAGKTPRQFTDALSQKYQELTERLNLSKHNFIRTTDQKKHWPTVKKAWLQLEKNGDIYKKAYRGLYCVGCETFLKEKDLVNGLCPLHNQKPEIIEEENYFFKLSKYAPAVKKEIENDAIKIIPGSRKNEILSFLGQEIEDISISRSKENLQWGVPVPGDKTQIIYIWFEALLNYLYPKKYWPANVQCVGKDIFRFHALLWPAMLLALGLELPRTIFVHGYITSNGQKMSKTLGNVVDPFKLIEKYGADALRYFLLREIPATEDGDYSEAKFIERYNGDLASGLGNLVARTIKLAQRLKAKVTKNPTNEYKEAVRVARGEYEGLLERFEFSAAINIIWGLIKFCDRVVEGNKLWEPGEGKKEIIANLLFVISEIAGLLEPFLPETSEKIIKQLKSGKNQPLFPRIN